jgi:hypothetical protein
LGHLIQTPAFIAKEMAATSRRCPVDSNMFPGARQAFFFPGITFEVGQKYKLKTIGDAPVVVTVYDVGGQVPEQFTFGFTGNPAYPAWVPTNFEECLDASGSFIGNRCGFIETVVGVGDGNFHSLALRDIGVPEPSSITFLAAALAAAALWRLVRAKWLLQGCSASKAV